MQEITPGIGHWSAVHPNLGMEVSSYWLPGLEVLLDPLAVPEEVADVEEIVLSNRHHKRSAFEARERFGAVVRVARMLMAHGAPLVGDGRERLRELAAYDAVS